MARSAQFAVAAVLVALLVAAPAANAVTCNEVVFKMSSCIRYAVGNACVSTACCDGLRWLADPALSKEDRQAACKCLKEHFARTGALRPNIAAAIPNICRV